MARLASDGWWRLHRRWYRREGKRSWGRQRNRSDGGEEIVREAQVMAAHGQQRCRSYPRNRSSLWISLAAVEIDDETTMEGSGTCCQRENETGVSKNVLSFGEKCQWLNPCLIFHCAKARLDKNEPHIFKPFNCHQTVHKFLSHWWSKGGFHHCRSPQK